MAQGGRHQPDGGLPRGARGLPPHEAPAAAGWSHHQQRLRFGAGAAYYLLLTTYYLLLTTYYLLLTTDYLPLTTFYLLSTTYYLLLTTLTTYYLLPTTYYYVSAQAPRPGACAYTCSKYGMTGLTKSIALDGRAHNIAAGQVVSSR